MDVFRAAVELAAAGRPAALVTVVRVTGSTPRHVGAAMLVLPDRSIVGTIGGGRIELAAIDAAVEVAAGAPARRVTHHLVRDLAMCCGGAMELYIDPIAPSRAALERAITAAARREPCLLVTPLDGSPRRVEPLAPAVAARPAPWLDGDCLHQPVLPPARVLLFGAGHVARAIGPVVARVGFEVTVCDDGEVEQLARRPAWAVRLVDSFELSDVERELGPLGAGDHALVVTRDHAIDERIVGQLLQRDAMSYVGLIGSRGKVGRFRRRLLARGAVTEASWARLHAPIGLDIGAETPDEIAIAVAAELVMVRNRPEER
jgi:xanthine dehydrogenase accessory factor